MSRQIFQTVSEHISPDSVWKPEEALDLLGVSHEAWGHGGAVFNVVSAQNKGSGFELISCL